MLKHLIIDIADRLAWFCKRRATVWLSRSRFWTDLSEAMESGRQLSDIQRERESGNERLD